MADIKDTIKSLPNSIDGDGSKWVSLLKKAMNSLVGGVNEGIDTAISGSLNPVANVTDLTLTEQRNANNLGYPRTDVLISWNSSEVENYSGADIWTRIGSEGSFTYEGNTHTNTYLKTSVTSNTKLYVKVLARNSTGNVADINNAPMSSINIIGSGVITPTNSTQLTVTWNDGVPLWQWLDVRSQDYFYSYELRENTNVGEYEGMLDSTTELSSTANPSQRSGIVYLYVRNIYGNYSYPIIKNYNKSVPQKPNEPVAEWLLLGLKLTGELIPNSCSGIEWDFVNAETSEEQIYETSTNTFTFFAGTGTWNIKYRFYDTEGKGEWSDSITATVQVQIGESQIKDNAITANKINANAVTADKINASAVTAEKIGANAVTTVKLEANAVTADKILAGAITAEKIASKAISTEKLATQDIDLTGALAVVGGNVKLSEEGLRLTGSDSSYTLFNGAGINYVDKNGITYAQVKKMIIGQAQDGRYIRFSAPWAKPPAVTLVPSSLRVNDANYPNVNVSIVCEPSEVSVNGFRVNCYSRLDGGSYGAVSPNSYLGITYGTPTYTSASIQPYNGDGYKNIWNVIGVREFTIGGIPTSANTLNLNANVSINSGGTKNFGSPPSSGVPSQYVRVDMLNSGGGIVATQVFTFGYQGANVVPFQKNFNLYADISGSSFVTIRTTISFLAKTSDNRSAQDVLNSANSDGKILYDYYSDGQVVPQGSLSIPSGQYATTTASKISTGYASFIVTDGSTNVYTVE